MSLGFCQAPCNANLLKFINEIVWYMKHIWLSYSIMRNKNTCIDIVNKPRLLQIYNTLKINVGRCPINVKVARPYK